MNKAGAGERKHVLFINADREYREGKAQNFLRPEDIDKIVHAYREGKDIPAYARRVPLAEIAAEEYNCNIRRYVDNAPPPEPHDVRAHLHGGVPTVEIESLGHYWSNYKGLKESCFVPRLLPSPASGKEAGDNAVELSTTSAIGAPSPHGGRLGWGRSNELSRPFLGRPHLTSPVGGGTEPGASVVNSTHWRLGERVFTRTSPKPCKTNAPSPATSPTTSA
jgi:hypothetical protein